MMLHYSLKMLFFNQAEKYHCIFSVVWQQNREGIYNYVFFHGPRRRRSYFSYGNKQQL
uniref:Uncharacterized protein n=1 Tax=Anguilla anguilla TaxID=7936 RepID=A0A0E9XK85_ANGAN